MYVCENAGKDVLSMTEKYLEILRAAKDNIFIFGTRDSSYVAINLLWWLGKMPAAFITNSESEMGSFRFGIPIQSPQAALIEQKSPVVFICSYSKKTSEKLIGQVKGLPVENPVFISAYELECLYIQCKRTQVNFHKVKDILGTLDLPCHSISTYMCSVEGDYACAWEDIQYISSHVQSIRTLDIRTPSSLIDSKFVDFVQKAASLDNVIYIRLKTDPYCSLPVELLDELKRYILAFNFWNFPSESLSFDRVKLRHFENLAGRIPFSYTEKESYQPQIIGNDAQLLTVKRLKEKIAEDIGVKIPTSPADAGQEICFVDVRDGLTNQMLSYFTACLISENTSKTVIIDDTYNHLLGKPSDEMWKEMFLLHHNSAANISRETIEKMASSQMNMSMLFYKRLELYDVFSCKFQLFSELFEKPVWEKILSKLRRTTAFTPLLLYLADLNCRMTYYAGDHYELIPVNTPNYISITGWMVRYCSEAGEMRPNFWLTAPMKNSFYYLMMPAQLKCWNAENRRWAQRQLRFPPIEDEYNQQILAQMMESDAVVIHIRRGDYCYLNPSITKKSEAYYRAALSAVQDLVDYPKKKYFIFSDDIQWCREHESELGLNFVTDEIIYVGQNTGAKSFRDLQLLSIGKIMIMAPGSTFAFCAFILNSSVEKYVCYTDYEELKASGLSVKEMVPRLVKTADC